MPPVHDRHAPVMLRTGKEESAPAPAFPLRRRAAESERRCLRREIGEELPKLKLGEVKLWKEVKARNRKSGRRMSDAIFVAKKVSGRLKIGDKKEIDKAAWCKPRGLRLTPTSRYIRDRLFPR